MATELEREWAALVSTNLAGISELSSEIEGRRKGESKLRRAAAEDGGKWNNVYGLWADAAAASQRITGLTASGLWAGAMDGSKGEERERGGGRGGSETCGRRRQTTYRVPK